VNRENEINMSVADNKLILKPVTELISEKFFIPSYQRGYRWTDRQVTNLLDDIWSFRLNSETESKEAFYCLQPIVVSKMNGEWEVLDGQQRLTTIYIILEYLKEGLSFFGKQNFSIRYQTRPDSETFLKNIDFNKCEKNIDYFHICQANTTISNWFKGKDGTAKINFLTTLLNDDESGKNVKVIWYDVSDENTSDNFAIDIFTRLNIGKIPLTNAELVKALFLQKGNFQEDKAILKQLQIASEWDSIEKTLQNNAFWYFIYNPDNPIKYDNRIEYIFDLMKGKSKDDEVYYTFYKFQKDYFASKKDKNSPPDIDRLWLTIKKYFLSFEEWYNDKKLYHLVGFLVDCGYSINKIKNESQQRTKTFFKSWLKDEIRKQVNYQVDDLSYGRKEIRKILLLFNIHTILATENADIRFPFFRYKYEDWDIEHIRSQSDKRIAGSNRLDWLIDVLEYFTGERAYSTEDEIEIQQKAIDELERNEKEIAEALLEMIIADEIEEEPFNKLYLRVSAYFKEDTDFEDKDSIGNLALLDSKTNRSYGNALFPIKRKTIIGNDMNGIFVPICTKNVFLKSYSRKLGEVMYWNQHDANDYMIAIKQTLKEYLPEQTVETDE
jgi:uncharacterized protein with ParB-like and HNH nuclease domain